MPNEGDLRDGLRGLVRAHDGHLAASRALLTETERLHGALAGPDWASDEAIEAAVRCQQAAFEAVQRAEARVQRCRNELSRVLHPADWTLTALEDAVQAEFGQETVIIARHLLSDLRRTNDALLDTLRAIERLSKATEERLRNRLRKTSEEGKRIQSGRRAAQAYTNPPSNHEARFFDRKQ